MVRHEDPRGPLDPGAAAVLAELAALAEPDLTDMSPHEARLSRARRRVTGVTPVHRVETIERAGVQCFVYRAHEAPAPALVWFHGGGWVMGGRVTHDEIYRTLATRTGCHVIAPEYSLAPEHPFPCAISDAAAILVSLRQGSVDAVRSDRIGIGGDSAGGNVAAVAAMLSPNPRHRVLALAYPVTDARCDSPSYHADHSSSYLTPAWMRWFARHYLGNAGDPSDWRASPILAPASELRHLPTTYLLLASHDPLHDEATAFARRLTEAGVDTHLTTAHGLPHGFLSLSPRVAASQQHFYNLCEMIRHQLEAEEE